MADDRHARISEEAYRLWKAEGEPHGRDRDHWEQAERAFAGEGPIPEAVDPQLDRDVADAAPAVGDDAADVPAADTTTSDEAAAPAADPVAAAPVSKVAAKKPAPRRKRTT